MTIVEEKTIFHHFLEGHDSGAWRQTLDQLLPSIHPVDQEATRIWFAFWPLQLREILDGSKDLAATALKYELKGRYRLEENLESSVRIFYGTRHWPALQKALAAHANASRTPERAPLEQHIREVASRVASREQAAGSLLIGITAAAFMALRQLGPSRFAAAAAAPCLAPGKSPEQVLRDRLKGPQSFLNLFRTVDRTYSVIFDECQKGRRFEAVHGQDVSMASESDRRDYQSTDARCAAGPVPFDCRIGSCGTCWVGILGGKERLSEITSYEKRRLRYFGYDFTHSSDETHPPIRLACQTRCCGNISIVIPPWNGVLNIRRSDRE